MGGKSSPSGNTTSSTTSSPWSGQQPYLQQELSQAAGLYNSGQLAPQYYPGQTVASQSPQTQQAISDLTNTANSASQQGLASAANNQVTNTLNGAYADPASNPYFQGALNNISDAYARGTAAQTASAFNNAGSFGGSAYQETQGANNQAFANSLNDLGNTQYEQNRTNQLQAASLAPSTSNIPYSNIAQLANAGGTQDAYNQSLINAGVNKYNYNVNLPANSLSAYNGLIQGNYGSSGTSTQPYFSNSLASGLGLGASVLGGLNAANGLAGAGGLSSLWGSGAAGAGAGTGLSDLFTSAFLAA